MRAEASASVIAHNGAELLLDLEVMRAT